MSQQLYEGTEQVLKVEEASNVARTRVKRVRSVRRIRPSRWLVYAVIAVFMVVYLYPLLYLANVSLKTNNDFIDDPSGLSKTMQVGNYVDAWVKGNFATYFLNTVLYTGVSTFLQVLFALMAAYPIARGYIRWGGFFATFFVMSLFLPNNLIPQFQLMVALHLYNTQIGYILLSSAVGVGPLIIIGYLKLVPKELDEAAAIDGCGYFRCLFSVITPLVKPALVTVAILHAIGVWNDIIGPTIYLTNKNYYPIALGLQSFRGQFSTDWTLLASATLIAALPLILLYVFFQRYLIEGAVAGAVK